jgi:hypothetical protein
MDIPNYLGSHKVSTNVSIYKSIHQLLGFQTLYDQSLLKEVDHLIRLIIHQGKVHLVYMP